MIKKQLCKTHFISQKNRYGETKVYIFNDKDEFLKKEKELSSSYHLNVFEKVEEPALYIHKLYSHGKLLNSEKREYPYHPYYLVKNENEEEIGKVERIEDAVKLVNENTNTEVNFVKVLMDSDVREYSTHKIYRIFVNNILKEELVDIEQNEVMSIARSKYQNFMEIPIQVGEVGNYQIWIDDMLYQKFKDSLSAFEYVYELQKTLDRKKHIRMFKQILGVYGEGEFYSKKELEELR